MLSYRVIGAALKLRGWHVVSCYGKWIRALRGKREVVLSQAPGTGNRSCCGPATWFVTSTRPDGLHAPFHTLDDLEALLETDEIQLHK